MRYIRGPVAAVLAFVIGVAVPQIYFQIEDRSPIQFEATAIGERWSVDDGYVTLFRSSDFVTVSLSHSVYESSEDANEVLTQNLAKTVQVLDLAPKLNEDGTATGGRALAIFFDEATNEHYVCAFWTGGSLFHSICSLSAKHVIEFENQNVR